MPDIRTTLQKEEEKKEDCLPFTIYGTEVKRGFLLFSFNGRMLGVLKLKV